MYGKGIIGSDGDMEGNAALMNPYVFRSCFVTETKRINAALRLCKKYFLRSTRAGSLQWGTALVACVFLNWHAPVPSVKGVVSHPRHICSRRYSRMKRYAAKVLVPAWPR